ncbi:hypothetical protein DFS34DRAFT_681748 [Phlyctochytrium arcticum]|nr:hypothetical protein DFS34DRAFT_681748 [Phlyctochytrium arcticum]
MTTPSREPLQCDTTTDRPFLEDESHLLRDEVNRIAKLLDVDVHKADAVLKLLREPKDPLFERSRSSSTAIDLEGVYTQPPSDAHAATHRVRVGIVGAGWYGCHLAKVLMEEGYQVTIFERRAKIFTEASRWNQFRLHQGFHYARSAHTRLETIRGFKLMREVYPELTSYMHENLYSVADESELDLGTVIQIMHASGLRYEFLAPEQHNLQKVQGVLRCFEQCFLPVKCQEYFEKMLGPVVRLNTAVDALVEDEKAVTINGEEFDFALDCTFNHMTSSSIIKCYFEPCLTLLYRFKKPGNSIPPSHTIIDGNFVSLFEYRGEKGELLFTLTSVSHTPLGRFDLAKDAETFMESYTEADVQKRRPIFEEQAANFIKDFMVDYEYAGYFLSCKTKLKSNSANRECVEHHTGRTMTLFGGKITGVFHAEQFVRQWLEARTRPQPIPAEGPLRRTNLGMALIGSSTLIGKSLMKQTAFAKTYPSADVKDISDKQFDSLVCVAVSDNRKYNSRQDLADVRTLMSSLRYVNCETLILISTVEVFDNMTGKVDESADRGSSLSPYGQSRAMLEEFVRKQFPRHLICRLPNAYGHGLSQNTMESLMNKRLLHAQAFDEFQLYPIGRLWEHIEIAIRANLRTLHLATEPVTLRAALGVIMGDVSKDTDWLALASPMSNPPTPISPSNAPNLESGLVPSHICTQHSALWGMDQPYILTKDDILVDLRSFVRQELAKNLAISNSCWTEEEEPIVLRILSSYGISRITFSPQKIWPDLLGIDQVLVEETRQKFAARGFQIASFDASLYGQHGLLLFGTEGEEERFVDYVQFACRIAQWLGAEQVVVTCPTSPPPSDPEKLAGRWSTALTLFREIADEAKVLNVGVCIRPTPKHRGHSLLSTMREAEDFVLRLRHDNVELALDTACIVAESHDANSKASAAKPADIINDYIPLCGQVIHSHHQSPNNAREKAATNSKTTDRTKSMFAIKRGNDFRDQVFYEGTTVLETDPEGIASLADRVRELMQLMGRPY